MHDSNLTALEDYFVNGSDDCKDSKLRFRICLDLWEDMKSETESVQDDLNKKILDSLLEFAKKSASSFMSREEDWASRMRASEIPVAALVLDTKGFSSPFKGFFCHPLPWGSMVYQTTTDSNTKLTTPVQETFQQPIVLLPLEDDNGVNLTDHNMTFQSLSDRLQHSVTPFVVSVQAKECAAVKYLLQKVLQRLTGVSMDKDEEETSTDLPQKSAHCFLRSLCDWYKTACKNSSGISPGKKRSFSQMDFSANPPIIVILKDLEAFSAHVLHAFILICSQYTQQLPLLFIFGIATSLSTVQRMLPHSVTSMLSIKLFQASSCTKHLATVIDKLVLTPKFPFKPSGKVLQVLVGLFLYHDFSVHNFIKGLQFCLLEHFHSQPLSVLCCKKQEAVVRTQQLSHQEMEKIRQLPSFMRFVEEQEPQEQVELLTSDEHLKELCQKLLKGLHRYHKNFFPILRCLHVLTSTLPKYPLGKQIRELHVTCLERNVWETEEYESAVQLLRILARDELLTALQKCVEILLPGKTKELRDALKQLQDLKDRLEQLDAYAHPLALDRHVEGRADDCFSENGLQKKTDLFQLQKTLLQMKDSRRTKERSPFELLRNETIEYIHSLVKMHLTRPESQPLYEVCYCTSSGTLRHHLNATPRTSLQMALTHPYCYLQNEALRNETGAISSAAPDICIVYKLHLECGRLINLYDWLEAYSTVVIAAEGEDPDPSEKENVDEIRHACFIRAVSELEFLGFVKSTKQKTDHVARLTWGGC
ncbi:origin recognition complex subunit 3 isoform X3 [Conger conger]|uniref:origin recognition complex subunit 3 isoform X3 n=1 Tax=Conger conger TaxID=82655 RepID=UPI002A59C0E1|nr:origin recognition complex subunit 3 isoform X3 [Conger conger]